MRMGQREKPRRGETSTPRADAKGRPRYAAAGGIVGKISPDIISTYFAPEMISNANSILEAYTGELVVYDDLIKEYKNEDEAPTPPRAPLYKSQYWVDRLEETLTDTADHFQGKSSAWKVQVNAARFERRMDEKYGIFRPFLKNHPEMELFVRSMQRKYAQGYFSPFRQGKAPIPKSTAVIILFMMQRGNVHWQVMLLSTLFFLIGLQPWALVVLVAGAHRMVEVRKNKPRKPMTSFIPSSEPYYSLDEEDEEITEEKVKIQKEEILLRPVGQILGEKEEIDGSEYDTFILGSGAATLYTAALLSRAGRKVLVLSAKPDVSGCYAIEQAPPAVMKKFRNVPFDIESNNVSKISRQQILLSGALSSSTDPQGGVRFAKIGSEADGHAFEILSVPGMGADGSDSEVPFVLRADGLPSLMEDAALSFADGWPGLKGDVGNSTTGLYAATCNTISATSNQFYLSKLLPDSVNGMRSSSTYQDASIRYASAFLDKGFPVNAHTRSLMAAIGMKEENIKPNQTSMAAHVSNISSALSGEGYHYPIGGPRALCHALATVVEQNEGRIITKVPVSGLIFEEDCNPKPENLKADNKDDQPAPRCVGIKLVDNRIIKMDPSRWESHEPAVVSMHGFVSTFIRLVPEDVRIQHKVPRGLPALSERRPVFKIMFALDGSNRDLDLTGADFYRVPGAALAQDEINLATGEVKLGEIGWVDEESASNEKVAVNEINEESNDNPQESASSRGKRERTLPAKKKREKFETGASWIQIAFPSAKDPSFQSRHGKVTTCVVTIEADDDFVTPFETKPKLYSIQKGKESSDDLKRLIERVRKDLLENFPQLEGKIMHSQLLGPLHRGLSHNPERFAAKGVRPDTPYPGLYLGGADLTVESFSGAIVGGWLAANAVMGYTWLDHLFLQKNVTSDIAKFLEPSGIVETEDLAVPFKVTEDTL